MTEATEYGEPCMGNMGQWGRTVTHWVNGPLGMMPVVDWQALPDECDCMSPFLVQPLTNSDGVRYCGYCKGRLRLL